MKEEDSSQLWKEALVRLKIGEEKIKLATRMCGENNYADAILEIHYAVYHTARAILYVKDIQPEIDSQPIVEFGLNFLQSGIIDKENVKPYLTFKRGRENNATQMNPFPSDREKALHMLNDAKHFIKDVKKYIARERRRRRACRN